MPNLFVIVGASRLSTSERTMAWAQAQAEALFRTLAAGDAVLTDATDGFAAWLLRAAQARGARAVGYCPSGARFVNGAESLQRWHFTPGRPPWDDMRDALVAAAVRSSTTGWRVRVRGLALPPEPPDPHDTFPGDVVASALAARLDALAAVYPQTLAEAEAAQGVASDATRLAPSDAPDPFGPGHILFADTETTGQDTKHCAMIEIAAIRTDARAARVFDEYEARIVVPAWAVFPREIKQLIGYSPEAWRDARPLHVVLAEMVARRLFENAPVLGGHNVSFDRRFLLDSFARAGLPPPPLGDAKQDIDTLKIARRVMKHERCHKLNHLAERLGIDTTAGHRAMADIRRTVKLYRHLVPQSRPDEQPLL